MPLHNYKELKVWQKSILLSQTIYELTAAFPTDERFGMVSQLRRAAVSIAVNIAEGSGRSTDKDFRNFLSIAYGSSLEVETLLILSKNFWLHAGTVILGNNKPTQRSSAYAEWPDHFSKIIKRARSDV